MLKNKMNISYTGSHTDIIFLFCRAQMPRKEVDIFVLSFFYLYVKPAFPVPFTESTILFPIFGNVFMLTIICMDYFLSFLFCSIQPCISFYAGTILFYYYSFTVCFEIKHFNYSSLMFMLRITMAIVGLLCTQEF